MSYRHLHAQKIIDSLTQKLSSIRAGRVNASILDPIVVEAYGTEMKLNETATITSPEPAQLLITPFDKSIIPEIVKAITNSNLGVNPVDDGAGVRLTFPPLTEETRKVKAKEIGKYLEETRIIIRSSRQDLLKSQKHQKEEGEISEDDLKRFENELQKEVDTLNKEVEEIAKKKEGELMEM